MSKKLWWIRLATVTLLLGLLVSLLVACDDDDNEGITVTVTETATATATLQPTSQPTTSTPVATGDVSDKPVKIGSISEWTGPGAMTGLAVDDGPIELMEWYVNEKLGGISVDGVLRPIKIIKCDSGGEVSQAANCATKLITDDNVSIIVHGGISNAAFYGICDTTDPAKVAFVTRGSSPGLYADYKYTANVITIGKERASIFADFILGILKPSSVALLAENMEDGRDVWAHLKPALEVEGVDITSEDWVVPGTADLSPYLTKIKHDEPDLLISYLSFGTFATEYKQIVELGGWGGIQNLAGNESGNLPSIASMPGAQGSYSLAEYIAGSSEPGTVTYEELWAEKAAEDPAFGKKYNNFQGLAVYGWAPLVVAIEAIKLADSDDPSAIAEILRSGKVEVDTPQGHTKIGANGLPGIQDKIVQIGDGGELVVVYP